MDNSRYIKLEKAYNFREIGNLPVSSGFKMKPGILFRSDELSKLTKKDLKRIELLNIKTVIDLRAPAELKNKIDRLPSNNGIRYLNMPIYNDKSDAERFKLFHYLTKKAKDIDFEKYIVNYYYGTAFERTERIKEIFTILSDEKNLPALIHCSVGKDRTGYISALLQLLAGIPRDVVLNEYMLTKEYILPKTKQIIRFFRMMSLFRITEEQVKPMLDTRPEYLNTVLDILFSRHGSVEAYLTDACSIDKETVIRLKKLIVE